MTKEALQEQHKMIIGLNNGSSEDAAKLSIQYAISVLEEVRNNKNQGQMTDESVYQKIHDLKSMI